MFSLLVDSQQRVAAQLLPFFLRTAAVSFSTTARVLQDVPQPLPLSKMTDSFLYGTSSTYLEELEKRYQQDPKSVDKTWASFFKSLESGVSPEQVSEAYYAFERGQTPSFMTSPLTAAAISNQTIHESMKLLLLVRAYQVQGHLAAKLDPLGLDRRTTPIVLDPAHYGLQESDMDREFFLGTWHMKGFLNENVPVRTLRQVVNRLQETYCGHIGYEYMHIMDPDKCNWIRERVETLEPPLISNEKKIHMLDRLGWSTIFETFLSNKYPAAKRFGLEGCETLVPGMKHLIDTAAELGVESFTLGMPHRGRLNVLANVLRKPLQQIFSEFSGVKPPGQGDDAEFTGSGDVKYHLGTSYDRPTAFGKKVHLSLVANPSHLEAVDPIVLGKTRAKEYFMGDTTREKNLAILLHGDGSFSGQGIVYESLDMSALPDYTVGGTIHLVVNNQIAFTTDPRDSRSSPYCTDVAKALEIPIFHVNGDDLEAVVRVMDLAAAYRQTFHTDVVIDIVCYRKYGHNEIDEPMFTQPLMYKVIKAHKSAYQQYIEQLIAEGAITGEQVTAMNDNVMKILNEEFENSKTYESSSADWLASYWKGFNSPAQHSRVRNVGVPMEQLMSVGEAITTFPQNFHPHKQIKKVYDNRSKMMTTPDGEGRVDWAMAEALAFGTLLAEGNHVRLSGQDVERGTFSHRHAVLHDQNTGTKYIPLDNVFPGQEPGQFTVSNSSLSEFGILGFELGYSMENPNQLVLWEAQFGDFANGAQVIFDQFLSSGEEKWLRQSGLVVLLPHGYDGQGPEHSSCRIERFLQQVNENPFEFPHIDESKWFIGGHLGSQIQQCNWQVVNCTTPVNYFMALRRQIHRNFRKPLIVASPKNLLRHEDCRSFLWEFDDKPDEPLIQGVRFKRLIMDKSSTDRSPNPPLQEGVKRLILCSGKVYYELDKYRVQNGLDDQYAIVRVEQLAPFPFDLAKRELLRFPNADIVWCQEEPMNMGAYYFVKPRMVTCMKAVGIPTDGYIKYSGRAPSGSTATGYAEQHSREQTRLIEKAFDMNW